MRFVLVALFLGVAYAQHSPEENIGVDDPNLFEGDMILTDEQRLAARMGLDVDAPSTSARKATITAKQSGVRLGNYKNLSKNDIKLMNLMYECSGGGGGGGGGGVEPPPPPPPPPPPGKLISKVSDDEHMMKQIERQHTFSKETDSQPENDALRTIEKLETVRTQEGIALTTYQEAIARECRSSGKNAGRAVACVRSIKTP
ncbi:hypothetical protein AC249_AIPGENE4058 [Exaiptasia diaphana]|nr:hypothetical protein AC249_AIPGENE4058 [Exaiptasia diaphana]